MPSQQRFSSGSTHNSALFSNHWLEYRLRREREWEECKTAARTALDTIVKLWATQKTRVTGYAEAMLEVKFIQPILDSLGWRFYYQPFLDGRKPDYALFLDDASLQSAGDAGKNSPMFWSHAEVVADAKAWNVSLDRPAVVNNQREYPPQQIEWYLDRSRKGFGILTNGGRWKLSPRERLPYQPRFQTYFEFDLASFLTEWEAASGSLSDQAWLFEEFICFYLFFGVTAFTPAAPRTPLIQRACEGSSEYRLAVGERLKERTFEALRLVIQGLLDRDNNGLVASQHLTICREQGFVLLYRLLFIMYGEDRQLLPYNINAAYTANRSLGRLRNEIASRLDHASDMPAADYSKDETTLYEDLLTLFDLIDSGRRSYGVPPYNGGLFAQDKHQFLLEKRISDWHLSRVIDQLGRAIDPELPRAGLFRVDYRDLAIQHLGGIYEGLLELHPRHTSERKIVVRKRKQGQVVEKIISQNDVIPAGFRATDIAYPPGAIYLETDKGERKATGSYYTPDHIVTYIVENTLGPLCQQLSSQLDAEIVTLAAANTNGELDDRIAQLKSDYDDRVLRLHVLDPAMGSGHFLIRACQYLAEEIATHRYASDSGLWESASEESALVFWKRMVAENCLYGVDMNGLAVELAKLALWLETVATDKPLTFLDHHLRHGNSLIGGRIATMGVLPFEIADLRGRGLLAGRLIPQVQQRLPMLLRPLVEIQALPTDSTANVRKKQELFDNLEKTRQPFRTTANLWCSQFVRGCQLSGDEFQRAVAVIERPRAFSQLIQEAPFATAIRLIEEQGVLPFHCEIEFPEVFFNEQGRQEHPGFDAVIGNPPYDVLSELESGCDLSTLRAYIAFDLVYEPANNGKKNLYKLFICRALEMLKENGYVGFITPMSLLGDKIVSDVRRKLFASGQFTKIEAFPQKDDWRNRVFPEAKLSTAVFVYRKDASRIDNEAFIVRRHPGRLIEQDSATLSITYSDVTFFEPDNVTIFSAGEADCELLLKLLRSDRMTRLDQCDGLEFFQGEVNERNERENGNLTNDAHVGVHVMRGAGVCLYVVRPESQGNDLLLDVERFLEGKSSNTKAFHHRYSRVALQESCPQNTFRRIIAGYVPAGHFCNHTINYCPQHKCPFDVRFLMAVLNSKMSEWYFRLGSSNNHVSHYQLYKLPCPRLRASNVNDDMRKSVLAAIAAKDLDRAMNELQPLLESAPYDSFLIDVIVAATDCIIRIEQERGDIRRVDRSALAAPAQEYQDFIDRLFYRMADLSEVEIEALTTSPLWTIG